jgi:aspartate 1-decarboxylase
MKIQILKSKIHRARVTEANLNYIGSIDICPKLMEAAGIKEHEKVLVVNFNTGYRYETYAVTAKKEGTIAVNGAGARYSQVGDILMIVSFAIIDENEKIEPKIIHVDEKNQIKAHIPH